MKTNVFLTKLHRILGTVMFPVFFLWCLSGFVMIFHGFPHVNSKRMFDKQPPLSMVVRSAVLANPDIAWQPAGITLQMDGGKPVYEYGGKLFDAFSLDSIATPTEGELDRRVQVLYEKPIRQSIWIDDVDIWLPSSSYRGMLPIKKYVIDDDAHTQVYVSARNGKIIQETTRQTRFFAYTGAIPHLFYYRWLRLQNNGWKSTVIVLSVLGMLVCLSGCWISIRQAILARKRRKCLSPYKKKMYAWHHLSGLFFGFIYFSFLLSGMFWLVELPDKRELDFRQLWQASPAPLSAYKLNINHVLQQPQFAGAKRVTWKSVGGKPYYYLFMSDNTFEPVIINAEVLDEVREKTFELSEIEHLFAEKFAETVPYSVTRIGETDGYYNLPDSFSVARFELQDADNTWIYINTASPDFLPALTKNQRIRRWLYHGLHTFDIPYLFKHQWLRKTILLGVLLLLFVITITGVVLGVKYVRRLVRRKKKKNL